MHATSSTSMRLSGTSRSTAAQASRVVPVHLGHAIERAEDDGGGAESAEAVASVSVGSGASLSVVKHRKHDS
jgi:hypothetical protein